MKEGEDNRTLFEFYYFIHERIYRETNHGRISRKNVLIVLRRNHNIPKEECPILLKELEMLGLLIPDGKRTYIVKEPKPYRRLILESKKNLNLI